MGNAQLSLVVSIVSHGHGDWILRLFEQIHRQQDPSVQRVVLTLNIPEENLEKKLKEKNLLTSTRFKVDIVRNQVPKGFGANHNAALLDAVEDVVCILNPDITLLQADTFKRLAISVDLPEVGLAYPRLRDETGCLQDNERSLPTLTRLIKRRLGFKTENTVDWVSGACMVLKTKNWKAIAGFNERFFMYCEDVELSLRVRRDIGRLHRSDVTVQHQAQRASRRKFKFLLWHIRSLLLLWSLPVYHWGCKNLSSEQCATESIDHSIHN